MVSEVMEEYALDSAEVDYGDPGEQAPMVFMDLGEGFHDGNYSHWWDQKHNSFTSQT